MSPHPPLISYLCLPPLWYQVCTSHYHRTSAASLCHILLGLVLVLLGPIIVLVMTTSPANVCVGPGNTGTAVTRLLPLWQWGGHWTPACWVDHCRLSSNSSQILTQKRKWRSVCRYILIFVFGPENVLKIINYSYYTKLQILIGCHITVDV